MPFPYLHFQRQCAEAMQFYAKIFDGKLEMMKWADSPESAPKSAFATTAAMNELGASNHQQTISTADSHILPAAWKCSECSCSFTRLK